MTRIRHGRLWCAVAVAACAASVSAAPLTGQDHDPPEATEAALVLSDGLVHVLVDWHSAARSAGAHAVGDRRPLLELLTSDPSVRAVLAAAGGRPLTGPAPDPPGVARPDALPGALAGGVPVWLVDAIQRSLDAGTPVVTPIHVLLAVVRKPAASTP